MTLTCDCQKSWRQTYLYWIRLVSGTFPEVLGGTLAYDLEDYVETHHITAKLEPGKLILHILETQLSDTAIYYCIKVSKFKMTFLKGTFLRIKGKYSKINSTVFRAGLCWTAFITYYNYL